MPTAETFFIAIQSELFMKKRYSNNKFSTFRHMPLPLPDSLRPVFGNWILSEGQVSSALGGFATRSWKHIPPPPSTIPPFPRRTIPAPPSFRATPGAACDSLRPSSGIPRFPPPVTPVFRSHRQLRLNSAPLPASGVPPRDPICLRKLVFLACRRAFFGSGGTTRD